MRIRPLQKTSTPSSILEIKELETIRIVCLQGPVDINTVSEIVSYKRRIEDQKEIQHKHVLLDFLKVTHTDSATVAVLIDVVSSLKREHHKLAIINVGERLQNLLEIYKVNNLVSLFLSETEAVRELSEDIHFVDQAGRHGNHQSLPR